MEKRHKKKRGIGSEEFKKAYNLYFNQTVIENVDWVSKSVCVTCYGGLLKWFKGEKISMNFGTPMIWTDSITHNRGNCYACANTVRGMNTIKAKKFDFKQVQSAQTPLTHSEEIPIPDWPQIKRREKTAAATTATNIKIMNGKTEEKMRLKN